MYHIKKKPTWLSLFQKSSAIHSSSAGVGFMNSFLFHAGMMTDLVLIFCRTCSDNHSLCEFMNTGILPFPEDPGQSPPINKLQCVIYFLKLKHHDTDWAFQRHSCSTFNFTLCSMPRKISIIFLLKPCPQLNILWNKRPKYFHIRTCIDFLWKQLTPISGNTDFSILTYRSRLLWLCGHQGVSPLRSVIEVLGLCLGMMI